MLPAAQRKGRSRQGGFTLIEMIFVVLVLALLASVTLPAASNVFGINLRSGATRVSSYLRTAYEQAIVRHERLRIRFDFTTQKLWAETFTEGPSVPLLDESTKIPEAIDAFQERAAKPPPTDEEKATAAQERYKKVEGGLLGPTDLPNGVEFKSIYLAAEDKYVESGAPWVEFSPGGFAPKTIVYLKNRSGDVFSIVLRPLAGKPMMERGEVRPEDV